MGFFSAKIPGVFGAGKSYLLSVVILFLVQLFESREATEGSRATPWKLLIASSTNVAVDRILLGWVTEALKGSSSKANNALTLVVKIVLVFPVKHVKKIDFFP